VKHSRRLVMRVLPFAIVATLVASGTLAAAPTLSVSQAVELGLSQNISLKIAELNNFTAQIAYEKVVASNPTPVTRRSAEINWEKAQDAFRAAKIDVVISTLGSYVALQNTAFDLQIKEKQADVALRNWEKSQILVQKGTAGVLDELQAQLNYTSAANNLAKAQDSFAESTTAFANMLGVDELPQLSEANLLLIPEIEITADEALQTALAHSLTIKDKEVALELAQIQRTQDELLGLARADDSLSKNSLKLAELNLAKARADFTEDVISSYNALVQLKKSLAMAQSSLEMETRKFDIVRKQYDAGLKTPSEVENSEIALLSSQRDLRNAHRSYVLAWLSFQKTLGNDIDLSGVVKPDASDN
jgi:outer membrane protein TolC